MANFLITTQHEVKLKCPQTLCLRGFNGSPNLIQAEHSPDGRAIVLASSLQLKLIESCKHLYDVYSDIAHTYHEISKGDYISRLVAEEQYKCERDEQQKKKNKSI